MAVVAVALVVALACAGCRASGRVSIVMARDGSGSVAVTVTLDAEALARLGDPRTALSTGDLAQAGWKVGAPARVGPMTSITVSKPFGSAGGLASVMSELSGSSGLFTGWRGAVTNGFASTSWSVTGSVAASGDLAQFSDERLTAALDGLALGRTPAELQAEWGGSAPSLPLRIDVRLPSARVQSTSVDLAGGSAQRRRIDAHSTDRDAGPTIWFLSAGLALALGGAVLVTARLRVPR